MRYLGKIEANLPICPFYGILLLLGGNSQLIVHVDYINLYQGSKDLSCITEEASIRACVKRLGELSGFRILPSLVLFSTRTFHQYHYINVESIIDLVLPLLHPFRNVWIRTRRFNWRLQIQASRCDEDQCLPDAAASGGSRHSSRLPDSGHGLQHGQRVPAQETQ